MHIIPQATYAQALATTPIAQALGVPVSDSIVLTGTLKVIEDLIAANPAAINKANPPAQDPTKVTGSSPKSKNVIADITKLYTQQVIPSLSLSLLGEDHNNADDATRATDVIQGVAAATITATLLVFERGMAAKYPIPGVAQPIVREENLTTVVAGDMGLGLTKSQRSVVVAGYIFLLLAGGDQHTIDKVILFYGENHNDILTSFEYFVRHTTCSWVQNRPRTMMFFRSAAPAQ